MKALDIVTVGHFSIDHVFPSGVNVLKIVLGGSPAYVSFAARKLGANVGVISKVGADFREAYVSMLKRNGVDLFGLKVVQGSATTSFALEYMNESRRLSLKSCAPSIHIKDVQLAFKAKIIHVAPIANEISSEVVEALREKANVLSLDPQGFLRKFDAKGRTSLKERKAQKILELIDVYKSSLPEIRVVAGKSSLKAAMEKVESFGVKVVIVTLSSKGTMILFDETFHRIPAIPPKRLIDSTGAGDVFAGAFLAEYLHEKDLVRCACVASAASSFKVETSGPLLGCAKEAIYERAEGLVKRCILAETHNAL